MLFRSVSKVLNPNGEAFSLYAGAGRSICVGEEDTESMPLYFTAFPGVEDYTLQVSRQESMNTEALWLEDRQSGVWTDLFNVDVYNFRGVSGDIVPRFYVHFKQCAPLGLSEGYDNRSALSAFYSAGSIYVQGLDAEDLESDWRILDMQGRLLMQGVIKSSPEMIIPTDLLPGIYALFVGGERNQSFNFVVKRCAQ